jgi:predicted enzyme related to lactoylglutathione lyase
MATLTYASLIAHDIEALADFYQGLFDLEEVAASRSEKYREFLTGGSKLGIVHFGGYAMLDLPVRDPASPVSQILTFDVGTTGAVDAGLAVATTRGAKLVKAPFETFYGQYLAVLLDPEGNAFRISAPAAPAA